MFYLCLLLSKATHFDLYGAHLTATQYKRRAHENTTHRLIEIPRKCRANLMESTCKRCSGGQVAISATVAI